METLNTMNNTLKSGACPKCNSTEVYTDAVLIKRGDRMRIVISSLKSIFLDSFLCLSCGYFEEHVPEEDLKDEKLIEKIKKNWEKVK